MRSSSYIGCTLVALAATLGGCKAPADLAGLPVYGEGFQRTYFEAQNHLAKGDLDLAYTSFLACLDMQGGTLLEHTRGMFETDRNEAVDNNCGRTPYQT